MSRRDWLLVIGVIFAVWGVDQVTKWWAWETLTGLKYYGPIGFVRHRNPGAILGMFSDLPAVLRVVSLSTGGAFLVFIYAAIQYLLPHRSLALRLGMSILLGGILGNVTDRIFDGSVIDFIVLGRPGWSTPAFNLADFLQWIGYFLIVGKILRDGNELWPRKEERKQRWVNPKFQRKYIGILIGIGSCFALIVAVFSYTYLKIIIDELVVGPPEAIEKKFIGPYMFTFFIIAMTFLLLLFWIGRIVSHRTAGPLYAFELFIQDLLKGKLRPLKLRAGDEFIHLEQLADQMLAERRSQQTNKSPE